MFEQVKEQIEKFKKIVFVTGAGISQESGIPTFRGKDGLWKNHYAMSLATIEAFYDNPKLTWEWYNERRANVFQAQPNLGHDAIAELEKYAKVTVLTQNIDGLHQKSGSTKVLELHGSIVKIKCLVCNYNEEIRTEFSDLPPRCKCGNMLRPDVVWFGESLPDDTWQNAKRFANDCDLMVVVGTSLAVSPANTLPSLAKENGAVLLEINPEKSEMSYKMDIEIRGTAAKTLPELISVFRNKSS